MGRGVSPAALCKIAPKRGRGPESCSDPGPLAQGLLLQPLFVCESISSTTAKSLVQNRYFRPAVLTIFDERMQQLAYSPHSTIENTTADGLRERNAA